MKIIISCNDCIVLKRRFYRGHRCSCPDPLLCQLLSLPAGVAWRPPRKRPINGLSPSPHREGSSLLSPSTGSASPLSRPSCHAAICAGKRSLAATYLTCPQNLCCLYSPIQLLCQQHLNRCLHLHSNSYHEVLVCRELLRISCQTSCQFHKRPVVYANTTLPSHPQSETPMCLPLLKALSSSQALTSNLEVILSPSSSCSILTLLPLASLPLGSSQIYPCF